MIGADLPVLVILVAIGCDTILLSIAMLTGIIHS